MRKRLLSILLVFVLLFSAGCTVPEETSSDESGSAGVEETDAGEMSNKTDSNPEEVSTDEGVVEEIPVDEETADATSDKDNASEDNNDGEVATEVGTSENDEDAIATEGDETVPDDEIEDTRMQISDEDVAALQVMVDSMSYDEHILFDGRLKVLFPSGAMLNEMQDGGFMLFGISPDIRIRITARELTDEDDGKKPEDFAAEGTISYGDDLTDLEFLKSKPAGVGTWNTSYFGFYQGVECASDAYYFTDDEYLYQLDFFIWSYYDLPCYDAYEDMLGYIYENIEFLDIREQAPADEVADFEDYVEIMKYTDHYFFNTELRLPVPDDFTISENGDNVTILTHLPDTQMIVNKRLLNDLDYSKNLDQFAQEDIDGFGDRLTNTTTIVNELIGEGDDMMKHTTITGFLDGVDCKIDSYYFYDYYDGSTGGGSLMKVQVITVSYWELPYFDAYQEILEYMVDNKEVY